MVKRKITDEELREIMGDNANDAQIFDTMRRVADNGITWRPNKIGLKTISLVLAQRPHLGLSEIAHEIGFQYYTRYLEKGGRTSQINAVQEKVNEILNKLDGGRPD